MTNAETLSGFFADIVAAARPAQSPMCRPNLQKPTLAGHISRNDEGPLSSLETVVLWKLSGLQFKLWSSLETLVLWKLSGRQFQLWSSLELSGGTS